MSTSIASPGPRQPHAGLDVRERRTHIVDVLAETLMTLFVEQQKWAKNQAEEAGVKKRTCAESETKRSFSPPAGPQRKETR